MRKIICLALSVTLLLMTAASASSFSDVSNDAWYKTAVDFVSENGIMSGYESKFNPLDATKRAEYVDALYNSSSDRNTAFTASFSDIPPESRFNNAIGWAEKNNITSGVGNNLFAPDDGLTREMAMTFLYRALLPLEIVPEQTNENLLSAFTDEKDVSDWAREAVNNLVNMGIIHGTDENKLEPQKVLNNAEVATIIYNMYSLKITDDAERWKLNLQSIDLTSKTSTSDSVLFENNIITITEGGDYTISGILEDGMIYINSESRVKLRLNNVNINAKKGSAIFVEAADKAFITMTDGTSNTITAENCEDAVIYSKDDLEIKGKGTLNVIAKTGHGIKASDDLDIENGNIFIEAAGDGIHINDTLTVLDGNINIKSVCDGIDSENATEIYGGTFDITTTGDILEVSSKGISSDISLEISGGNIKLNTTDKAIKSDGAIHITGGEININSAHKGISGIGDVTIDGGNIYIGNATEGIESKQTVTINGGDIYMNVSDDGLNSGADVIYSENPEKSAASKRPNTLIINGGNIEVYAQDDCIDSNAAAIFNGGIIKAARHRGEVIDTGAAPLTITNGATLIYTSQAEYAAENPNNVQNSVAFISNTQEENTKIIFEDSLGNEIVSFCPASKFEAVTITSPEIEIGNSYALIVGNTRYDVTANKKFTIISNSSGQKTSSTTNFEGKSFSMGGDEKIGYWLFTPQNATKNMPLIVYLHGSHGQGDDLSVVLQEDFVKMVSDGEFDDTPAYILIPQLSDKYKSWSRINSELIGLMDNVVNTYGINKNNISLMGYSLGGTGTVNLASAYPSYFSRIAILSGSARTTNDAANRLSGISVWAFVGSEDVIVKPEGAISLVEALKQNGEDARITVFDGADHIEVPPLVFSDGKINLVNWLIGK